MAPRERDDTVITLTPFATEHVGRTRTWEQDPRIYGCVAGYEPEEVERRIQARLNPAPDARHYALLNSATLHVGNASVFCDPDALRYVLYVGPEHQRHGYGRAAAESLRELGQAWAPGRVGIIRVFADEPGLREWWERLGFTRIDKANVRYMGELRPIYVMATNPTEP